MSHSLKHYHYDFPKHLIATHPCDKRDHSRLMVLNRKTGSTEHRSFKDITTYFDPGDVLVLNNSKVFACRLLTKRPTGGKQEIFLLRPLDNKQQEWLALINANHKVHKGDRFAFKNFTVTILEESGAKRRVHIEHAGNIFQHLEQEAHIPLPPYIDREDDKTDHKRYQTVYAKETGSVAAPTAGLHFTENLLEQLQNKGVKICYVTLHVGPGTFLPVRSDDITKHKMHTEHFEISEDTCNMINQAKDTGKKICAVGTTSTRVLEAVAAKHGKLIPTKDQTDIFIYPPYNFKIIDTLITNFHQPESTLLMLVSAFAGHDFVLKAYKQAISQEYRLFSYGDAMLILG